MSIALLGALAISVMPATGEGAAPEPGAWQLALELPIGVLSREAASRAGAELNGYGGLRAEVAWMVEPAVLALGLGAYALLPDQRGTSSVRYSVQETLLAPELRLAWRLARRGFALEPFALLRAVSAWRLTEIQVLDQRQVHSRNSFGGGPGLGLLVGHRNWRLRAELGVQITDRSLDLLTGLALGYAFP